MFKAFRIYQIKDIANTNYAYRGWSELTEKDFDFNDYKPVYMECIETQVTTPNHLLDELFVIFNDADKIKKLFPDTPFNGHSLSVSDVIKIENRYYYCDDIGWEDITEFVGR